LSEICLKLVRFFLICQTFVENCLKFIRQKAEICPKFVRIFSENCQKIVRNVLAICPKFVRNWSEICLKFKTVKGERSGEEEEEVEEDWYSLDLVLTTSHLVKQELNSSETRCN
jgi:hypothetical protein